MSKYLLYGEKVIKNDSTMRDFAESIIENIPKDDLQQSEDFECEFMERVHDSLKDDISRTDIDYEKLMHQYRNELGDLLYKMENHGYELEYYPVRFFGEEAQNSFNRLMYMYINLKMFYADKDIESK